MTDLAQLIADLESANEGSQKLDALLCAATEHMPHVYAYALAEGYSHSYREHHEHVERLVVGPDGYERVEASRIPTPVTTSLDAIVALIERKLPGWWVQYLGQTTKGWAVRIERQGTSLGLFNSTTPALALYIAFLRALQAQQETSEDE